MKLLGILMFVLIFLGIEPIFAQEAVVEVTPTTFNLGATVANVFSIFAHVIGIILAALAPWVVKLLLTKMNIQATQEMMEHVESSAITAVAAAEEWAGNQELRPTGNAKMDKALEIIKHLMRSDIVVQFTDEKLKELLSAALATNRNMIQQNATRRIRPCA